MKHYLHGESVLPLLAIVLFTLLFIAGALADAGALPRPFIGILPLIVAWQACWHFAMSTGSWFRCRADSNSATWNRGKWPFSVDGKYGH